MGVSMTICHRREGDRMTEEPLANQNGVLIPQNISKVSFLHYRILSHPIASYRISLLEHLSLLRMPDSVCL